MTVYFEPWLPRDAITGIAIEAAIGDAADSWSEKWFARETVAVMDRPEPFDRAALSGREGLGFQFLENDLAISVGKRERMWLVGMMLGVPVEENMATATDRSVLEDLADRCIEDFCAQLARAFKRPESGSWRDGGLASLRFGEAQTWVIGTVPGKPLIEVTVASQLAVAFIKRTAPPPPARRILQPLASALANQHVAVSAALGKCDVSLMELAALVPGDILVLDQALTEPAALAIDGTVKEGRFAVDQEGGQLRLKLLSPRSGKPK